MSDAAPTGEGRDHAVNGAGPAGDAAGRTVGGAASDGDASDTVARLVALIRSGERSAEEVTRQCLAVVEAAEPTIRAWAHLEAEPALAQARERDRQWTRDRASVGPLHGIPIGIKDIIDVEGMPTGNGADIPVAGPATRDADAVGLLRAAGAVVLGKTVTTEFALFRPGPTTNPHDGSRTPGGSSSGSAAAVAAGMVPLAVGTQTAGSVVRPASFCGVVGAKPTIGSVPRGGMTLCSPTLDTIGVLGRDVHGAALALGVMASDPENFTPTLLDDRVRIGFCRTFEWPQVDAPVQRVIEDGVERIASQLDVIEVTTPEVLWGLVEAQRTIMLAECAHELAPVRSRHPDLLSPSLLEVLDQGAAHLADVPAASAAAAAGRAALDDVFADVDVLIVPSVRGEAPTIETTGDPLLCRIWTLLGTPSIGVPGLEGPAGLPVGVQVIGPRGRDGIALGAAQRVAEVLADPS